MKKVCLADFYTIPDDGPAMSINSGTAVGFKNKFWKNGQTIRIKFLDSNKLKQDFVKKHAVEWLKFVNLKFEWVGDNDDADVRILFDSRDGAWSYLGTDALNISKSMPTMNLGWQDVGTVLHEFGHMLGLGHEHQNPDGGIEWNVDKVIKDLSGPPNNWDYNTIKWNVIDKYSKSETIGTTFDPDSIMLYFFPADWTKNGIATKQNESISSKDAAFLTTVYPFPKDPEPPTPVEPPIPVDPPKPINEKQIIKSALLKMYLRVDDLYRTREDVVVRMGRFFGLDTDMRYRHRTNAERVWVELNKKEK